MILQVFPGLVGLVGLGCVKSIRATEAEKPALSVK